MPVTSLHLTNAWHGASGGIRTFYQALIDDAARHGRRVALVVPGERTETREIGPHACIYTLEAPRAPAFDRRYRILYPTRYLPIVGRAIQAIVAREQPQILEICDKYSLPYLAALLRRRLLAGLARPPVLVGLSCERFDDNMTAYLNRGRAARAFTRWYIRHIYGPPFDVHLANSDYTATELREAMSDRVADFVRVCPMGVDTEGFGAHRRSLDERARMRRELGLGPDGVLLFYAGRLSPEKNLGLLVDTLRALAEVDPSSDYGLVVAGDGPLAPWLRTQDTGRTGGRLVLCGNLSRERLATICASCDVFVHPNPREPFGIGPLEAMASGVPVVLPAAGGVLSYASAQNAWLAEPTATAFAHAIRDAVAGDTARVAAAATTARAFAWPHVTARYFALHDEWLARRPSLARVRSARGGGAATGDKSPAAKAAAR
jgi:alpha-1,6-mannosyltransferase